MALFCFVFYFILKKLQIHRKLQINVRQSLRVFCQASPSVNILHNYSTISKPGNWHWCKPQSLYFTSYTYKHVCVHAHTCVCSFVQEHHNQNTELFHHHQALSCHVFRAIFSSVTPGARKSVLSLTLSLKEHYIDLPPVFVQPLS